MNDDIVLSEEQLAELNNRIKGKKTAKEIQEAVIQYYAELQNAKIEKKNTKQDILLKLDDSQLEKVFGMDFDAKKISKSATDAIANKYGMTHSDAKAHVDKVRSETMTKMQKRQVEDKIVAQCLGAMFAVKKNYAGFDRLIEAHKREADYLGEDTPFIRSLSDNKEEHAMSVGTDTTGGYFAPQIFSTQIYERLEKYGLARQFARVIAMESEIIKFPKLTADVTAAVTAEAAQITASDITADQLTLQPLKLAVMAGPFSDELLINAEPALVQILQESAARGLAKLEDNNVFIGTSASFTGLLESATNVVAMGTGQTSYADITFDDLINLVDELDERYVTEAAGFWYNKKITAALRKVKNTQNYVWGDIAQSSQKTILGYPYHHVIDATATTSANTKFGIFGDLDNVWVGIRGGMRIDLLTEGTVNSVNLGETASLALRVLEYWDNEIVDLEAFSI